MGKNGESNDLTGFTGHSEKRAIGRAIRLLEVFRSINPEMPMAEAISFLVIANGETQDSGISVTELSRIGDFPLSSSSRYVRSLGNLDKKNPDGTELITDSIDPMERRKKILRITPTGKVVITQIDTILGN